eukprot:3496296-Amphidinium_carterae.1
MSLNLLSPNLMVHEVLITSRPGSTTKWRSAKSFRESTNMRAAMSRGSIIALVGNCQMRRPCLVALYQRAVGPPYEEKEGNHFQVLRSVLCCSNTR